MRRNHLFLHFPLSYLQYTKHFIDDFQHKQFLQLPFEHEQVKPIIDLMLSVTASSCQCGTNEWTGSGFPPIQLGQYVGFNFTKLPKVVSLDTCSFYMLKDSRLRWN